MNIMLGNLNVSQIEERLGIDFPDDIRKFLAENHQATANNIQAGKWHCFDMPFHLVCGDMDTAKKIYDSVKNNAVNVKTPLQISISNRKQ